MSKYPRLGTVTNLSDKKTKECEGCSAPARYGVWVQVDWFRGNDELTLCCERHAQMARKGEFRQLFAHVSTKDEWLKQRDIQIERDRKALEESL